MERLPDPEQQYHSQYHPVHQYYYANQGPTYSGPGNYAPYPTYQEDGVAGWGGYHHRPHYGYGGYRRHWHHTGYGYGAHYGYHHGYARHHGYPHPAQLLLIAHRSDQHSTRSQQASGCRFFLVLWRIPRVNR